MHGNIQKVINGRFGVYVNKFFHSPLYIVLIAAVCAFCHKYNLIMIASAVFTVFLVFSFVFCKDLFVLVPFVVLCTLAISNATLPVTGYYSSSPKKIALILELALAAAALIFNLTYYKRWRTLFKRSYLTVSLSLVTAALLMGGIASDTFNINGVLIAAGLAATMFLPYALFINCGEYDGESTIRYIAWTAVAAAAVFGYFVLSAYVENTPYIFDYPKKYLHFGCFGANSGAAYILPSIPLTFYLIYSYKHGYLIYSVVAFELIVTALTFSRATIIVCIPITVILAVATFFIRRKNIGHLIATGIFLAAVVAFLSVFGSFFLQQYAELPASRAVDNGRVGLWKLGFEAWKSHPLFGLSLWFLLGKHYGYYSFHCTPLTYLFCCGAVGLCAYLYHRYKTIRLVFLSKPTVERMFISVAVLTIILNALLDVGLSFPMHLLVYSLLLAALEHDAVKHNNIYPLKGLNTK